MLVIERKDVLEDVDPRTMAHSLGRAAVVDRLTLTRLFAPAGLVALFDTRDSLVLSPRGDYRSTRAGAP